jgi:hypothetical protein
MTTNEHKLLTAKIKEATKEVSKDPKKAREMLMQTGFYTPTGKLKKACS